jgi:restriction system protein
MGIIRDMQRTHATQTAAQQRARTAATQQRELIRRNADLAIAAAQQAAADAERKREHRRLYVEARNADAAAANSDVRARLADLDALLQSTLDVDDHIDLDRFKKPVVVPPFDPGPLGRPLPPPSWASYEPVAPSGIVKLLGERQHQQQVTAARRAFSGSQQRWAEAEERRKRQLAERKQAYEASRRKYEAKIVAYNAEVDRFAAAVAASDPESVVEYFAMVLGNSVYPDDFPQHFRLAFQPKRRQLLIEYHLPPVEVIPIVKEYRYDQTRDDLLAVPRDETEVRRRYTGIIAQLALRTVHEIVEADRGALISLVSFNGIVDTIDRRTGQFVRPCLVSVQTDRETFAAINLGRVDPIACLKHLEAAVSRQPDALDGITPMIDFDREADKDLTGEFNVLAEIDERPNLETMSDDQYLAVLADLFGNLGLEMGEIIRTETGARWLAVDPRPIFGGKVVVDAARSSMSGAQAARSLADAVAAVGATKGILVTTGGFEAAAHEEASSRPLELVDGSGLLNLLAEHSRLKARIDQGATA